MFEEINLTFISLLLIDIVVPSKIGFRVNQLNQSGDIDENSAAYLDLLAHYWDNDMY